MPENQMIYFYGLSEIKLGQDQSDPMDSRAVRPYHKKQDQTTLMTRKLNICYC